ncbi:MAG: hypothetical protein ACRDX8_00925 [Acidimicrobiales bacterium]
MTTLRNPRGLESRRAASADSQLIDRLEWVESTASTHRAAAARVAGAHGESERRAAARELAIAREMHRAALAKLAVDFGKGVARGH